MSIRPRTPSVTIVAETNEFVVRDGAVYQRVIFRRDGQLRQGLRFDHVLGQAAA